MAVPSNPSICTDEGFLHSARQGLRAHGTPRSDSDGDVCSAESASTQHSDGDLALPATRESGTHPCSCGEGPKEHGSPRLGQGRRLGCSSGQASGDPHHFRAYGGPPDSWAPLHRSTAHDNRFSCAARHHGASRGKVSSYVCPCCVG